jgi:nicotinate phosphoribosyltransferase
MDVKKYTDKYFSYTQEILKNEHLDPWVDIQIFIRKGPGKVAGIKEAVDLIAESGIEYVNGRVLALKDGQKYKSNETIMWIQAPIQLIVEWETVYLGVISAETTLANGGQFPNLGNIKLRMDSITNMVGDRPVYYFGARHWRWDADQDISQAAFDGGAAGCSTDAGAAAVGQKGLGTMPHVLPIVLGSTRKAAVAFHAKIDAKVKRVILADTFNKEISDSIKPIKFLYENQNVWGKDYLKDNPPGIRLDTCGENVGETCHYKKGVTVELARKLRLALDYAGYEDSPITLSSGFANPEKVRRFVEAEKALGIRLFDSLGVGQLWEGRSATADIVGINGKQRSKVGRQFKPNKRLKRVL